MNLKKPTSFAGVDIGYSCKYDVECTSGNGGEYSKCNQDLNICICTINHLGEDKCMYNRDRYDGVCRQPKLYTKPGYCTLECSPKGTVEWPKNQDWYGHILEPFALLIHDKKTSVCYDPKRAFNSVPGGFEIKRSTIPNAGLGAFTNKFIERHTIFDPYKGTFEPGDTADTRYTWEIQTRKGEGRDHPVSVNAIDVTLSNWVRFVNTPVTAEMENLVAVQYKGEIYYQAFKSIQPGTELLVWYGEGFGNILGIEPFDRPNYYYAEFGYVGGACDEDEEGQHCLYDRNTVCADQLCICIPGTHIRAGLCIFDEIMGGICAGSDGDTCKHDVNAECQGGTCVCKDNSSAAYGICIPDETFGGRCKGQNGETCLLDDNAECVHGLCDCKYGTTIMGRKCVKDERYQGRCSGDDGEECKHDQNAECWDSVCLCKKNARAINGICRLDGALQGMCIIGKCYGQNIVCNSTSNICICKATYFPYSGKCVKTGKGSTRVAFQ